MISSELALESLEFRGVSCSLKKSIYGKEKVFETKKTHRRFWSRFSRSRKIGQGYLGNKKCKKSLEKPVALTSTQDFIFLILTMALWMHHVCATPQDHLDHLDPPSEKLTFGAKSLPEDQPLTIE